MMECWSGLYWKKRTLLYKKKNSLFKKIVQIQKFLRWKKRQNGSFCFACKKLRSQILQSAKIVAWKVGGGKKRRRWREGQLLCLCTAYLGVEFMLICLCQTIAKETRKENCEITFITFRFPLNFANAFTSRAESFARLKRWRSWIFNSLKTLTRLSIIRRHQQRHKLILNF